MSKNNDVRAHGKIRAIPSHGTPKPKEPGTREGEPVDLRRERLKRIIAGKFPTRVRP
jgi:hypothetical protein